MGVLFFFLLFDFYTEIGSIFVGGIYIDKK